jgi:general secretion pathway protein E
MKQPASVNLQAASGASGASPKGALDWRLLLQWLRDDGLIAGDEATRIAKRFAGPSSQHALVRLGQAGLTRKLPDGRLAALDTDGLTEWLAARAGLGYQRIDPLKVDVGRVADVMSVQYAELRRALPLNVSLAEVTIATAEPFDTAWVSEIESHMRRSVRLVLVNPEELRRYTTEFYALAKSVKAAAKTGEGELHQQLRAVGGARPQQQAARCQRPGRGAGRRLAVAVRL